MLKKAAAVSAIAASFLLVGSPAFAVAGGQNHHYGYDTPGVDWMNYEDEEENDVDQLGLVNMEDSELLSDIYLCGLEVVPIIPILSENDEIVCSSEDGNEVDIVNNETESHDNSSSED